VLEPIPSAFILSKASWSLPELEWAFSNGLIGAQTVVDMANSMVEAGDDSELVLRLAGLTQAELTEVRELLQSEASGDPHEMRAKWVWLVLSWVYENHGVEESVFDKLDALYADLGYPEEMEPFGPYAPVYQAKGDPNEMRAAVLGEWRRYLADGERRFGLTAQSL
jgi:hypothetical protein